MPSNIARIIGGPALVMYRGATFYTKGDIAVVEEIVPFNVATSRFGEETDKRLDQRQVTVRFTPAGEWENLGVLYPYRTALIGSLITPQRIAVEAINTTSDQLTATAHGLADGDLVLVEMSIGGAFPTLSAGALSDTTKYYVAKVDDDKLTLHPTYADAIADPPTNALNFTAQPTGTMYVDRDHPLTIWAFDGEKHVFHNAAVVGQPDIIGSAVATLFGEVQFEAFVRNGFDPTDENSIETVSFAALTDTSFDPDAILTVPFTAAWGATAPWDSFEARAGWRFRFPVRLESRGNDRIGNRTKRLVSASAFATAIPDGIDSSQLSTKLRIQGTGAHRGARLVGGDDLNVYGPDDEPYIRIYGARLRTGQRMFGAAVDRVGECEWYAARSFDAGVAEPLFYVGSEAPA